MSLLVRDLLALADVENLPHSRLQDFDFLELARICREELLATYPEALVFIEANEDVPHVLTGDRNLMRQALMNLLENAARYSPSPAQIIVGLQWDATDCIVSVSDKGVGIPATDLESIFQRFYTVDKSKSQKLGGSGLGLSIVETIVEKHFGKVTVESRVGEGSRFTLHLHRNPFPLPESD